MNECFEIDIQLSLGADQAQQILVRNGSLLCLTAGLSLEARLWLWDSLCPPAKVVDVAMKQ